MVTMLDQNIIGSVTVGAELSRPTEGPTSQQWADMKDINRDLYISKPLKDVRLILEPRYGFRAT